MGLESQYFAINLLKPLLSDNTFDTQRHGDIFAWHEYCMRCVEIFFFFGLPIIPWRQVEPCQNYVPCLYRKTRELCLFLTTV